MSSSVSISRLGSNGIDVYHGEPAQWPLSFHIKTLWSYELYRGPKGQAPELVYSTSKQDSEKLASQFLGQKIVGFGMEWVWYRHAPENERLQEKVSLIQVASEEKIALFHIAAYSGDDPEDFLAPSLRKIIESPSIIKAGAAIKKDFERLEETFKDLSLTPRGAMDPSHLHNLVFYGSGSSDQWEKCTTKLLALDKQVEMHFGLPLKKELIDWSKKPLTEKQQTCAASDAYAGLMLFHYLENKRAKMAKKPPRLLSAELYPWFKYEARGVNTQLLLVVDAKRSDDTETITVITAKDHLRGARHKTFQKVFRPSNADPGTGGDGPQGVQTEATGAGDAVGPQVDETGRDVVSIGEQHAPEPEALQRRPAPTTPPRPLPLSTGLSAAMAKTTFSGFGTKAQPLKLTDSSDDDYCKTEMPEDIFGAPSTPSKPQKRKRVEQQPKNTRHGRTRASSGAVKEEIAKVEND